MPGGDLLRFAYGIKAPVDQLYRAFTNAVGLQEWLCQKAVVDARPGGYIFLSWENGYFAAGEYQSLEVDRSVVFTWHGKGEPAISEVHVTFTPQADDVLVVIEHRGLGVGELWQSTRRQVEKGWIIGLENLSASLQEGYDRRIVDRPILGVSIEESPAHKNVPSGLKIADLLSGMSAAQAGLQKNDIITALDDTPTPDYAAFSRYIGRHRAGNTIQVEFYREGQKQSLSLNLMRRPMAQVAADLPALLAGVQELHARYDAEIENVLQNVTAAEAARPPAEGEWSVLQILAHMLIVERDFHFEIAKIIASQEMQFVENFPARIQAILNVYPDLPAGCGWRQWGCPHCTPGCSWSRRCDARPPDSG